jgi:tetratricopeptide (TPR) repeat protein
MSTKSLIDAALALEQTDGGNFDALVAAFEKCHRADASNEKMKEKYLSYFKKIFDRQHSKNENADELKQLGNQHLLKQQYEESILFYDAAINVDPMAKEAAPIYSNRSLAFFNLNKFKDAYDDAKLAIELNPDFSRGYLREAMSAMKLEKYQESMKSFRKYFEMDPAAKQDKDISLSIHFVKNKIEQEAVRKQESEKKKAKIRKEIRAQGGAYARNDFQGLFADAASAFDSEMVRFFVDEVGWSLAPYKPVCHVVGCNCTKQPHSSLLFLIGTRAGEGLKVSSSVLAEFDETILWLIEKMKSTAVPFIGTELIQAVEMHDCCQPLPNPRIVEALLATKQMKINATTFEKLTPLRNLTRRASRWHSRVLPPQLTRCFQMILMEPTVNVNLISNLDGFDETALSSSVHPEVTQILLRAGAMVNLELKTAYGRTMNALQSVLGQPKEPFISENVRVLIEGGARVFRCSPTERAMFCALNRFNLHLTGSTCSAVARPTVRSAPKTSTPPAGTDRPSS